MLNVFKRGYQSPYFVFFIIQASILCFLSSNVIDLLEGFFWALLFSVIVIFSLKRIESRLLSYPLFFSISFTSFFGLTSVLTGSHAESSSVIFYGLAFYSTSLAFLNFKHKIQINDVWRVSNPLLLFTGPVALFVKDIHYVSRQRRVRYYLPFILVGLFYFQIIGAPLIQFMSLLSKTDIVSAVVFAIIFELFVYANFCGLSLMVYGFAGIFGFKVPLNFRQPFSSTNLIDFWRGWHTSLSAVLKCLFYDPLRTKLGLFGTLLAVYTASAMWHGITFNFLIWGALHAICFYLTIIISKSKIPFRQGFNFCVMVCAIVFGRMVFVDSDISRLLEKLSFNFVDLSVIYKLLSVPTLSKVSLFLGFTLILIEFLFRKNRFVAKRNYKHLRTPFVQFILMGCILMLIADVGGNYAIYGQR